MITKDLILAQKALTENKNIAIPTETVYGLAGNAYSEKAIEKVFDLKKRPLYNPLIVHIKSVDFLSEVAREIPESAYKLAKEFWPGPLTLVLKKQAIIPDIVTAGKDTVAVRVPNHPLTLQLLERLDFPVAAPSANPFGSISPTCAQHVDDYFGEDLEVILDGDVCEKGIESTIIGFIENQAVLYRLGSLSLEEIERKIGKVLMQTRDDKAPAAPGMLSRHYAPTTETYFTTDVEKVVKENAGKKIGLLLFENKSEHTDVEFQEILSMKGDLTEAAKNLYAAMHRLDKSGLDLIIAEQFPDVGLGKTLNDKLRRASEK